MGESAMENRESILFPSQENNEGKVSSFALIKDYLVYSTDVIISFFLYDKILKINYYLKLFKNGHLNHFYIDEWQFVSRYKHDTGIKKIFPEPYGMSLAFVDDKSEAFIFNPVNSSLIKIPNFPTTVNAIIWDTYDAEKWVFIAFNGENIYTFIYAKYSCEGPVCSLVGQMRQPYSSLPLVLFKGILIFLDASGKIVQIKLDTHTHDITLEGLEQDEVGLVFIFFYLRNFQLYLFILKVDC